MSTRVTGDPSSCSQLGAELRSGSVSLLRLREVLVDASGRRRGGPRGVPTAPGGADPAGVGRDLALLDVVVDRLDSAGEALQRHAQELAALAEDERRLAIDVRAAGLELDGLRVVEPWGVADAALAATRLAALPALAARAERLSGLLARARGALRRTLEESTGVLERAAAARRDTWA